MTLPNTCAPLALLPRRRRTLCRPANGSLALRVAIGLIALIGFAILVQGPLPASAQADEPQAVPDVPDRPTATAIYKGMVDLEWNDVPGAASYDLQAFKSAWSDLPGNGVEIAFHSPGAIIRSPIPESRYYFRVRASNSLGSSEWSELLHVHPTGGDFGNWDGVPEPSDSEAAGAPTISGTTELGETLTADISGIVDENGLERVKFHYQWIRNDGTTDTDIEGASEGTYILVPADEGNTIRVQVSFTDRGGHKESLTTTETAAVAGRTNSSATGVPTISETAQVGETLTSDTAWISDPDGLDTAVFSYQWVANDGSEDTDISRATDSTYTLSVAGPG